MSNVRKYRIAFRISEQEASNARTLMERTRHKTMSSLFRSFISDDAISSGRPSKKHRNLTASESLNDDKIWRGKILEAYNRVGNNINQYVALCNKRDKQFYPNGNPKLDRQMLIDGYDKLNASIENLNYLIYLILEEKIDFRNVRLR